MQRGFRSGRRAGGNRAVRRAIATVLAGLFTADALASTVGFVYLNTEGAVAGYSVQETGVLAALPGSPYTTVASSSSCAVMTAIYDSRHGVLYVANPTANSVSAFRVDPVTGALTAVAGSPFALSAVTGGSSPPCALALDATRSWLYAGKGWGGTAGVDGFAIAADGSLTLLAGSPYGVGVSQSGFTLANDPVENTIIATSNSTDITVFAIGGGGALTPIAGSPFAGRVSNAHGLAVNPARRELAVGDVASLEAAGFQIAAGGGISGPAPATTGAGPGSGLAFTPDGSRLYGGDHTGSWLFGFDASAGPTFTPCSWVSVSAPLTKNVVLSPNGSLLFSAGGGTLRSWTLNPGSGLPSLVSTQATAGTCSAGLVFVPYGSGVVRVEPLPAGPVCAGSTLRWEIGWTNPGSATIYALTVTDTLPAGVAYQSPSLAFWAQSDALGTPALASSAWATAQAGPWTAGEPADGTIAPLLLRWTVDRVAPGRSGALRFSAGVSPALPNGSVVLNAVSGTMFGTATVYIAVGAPTLVVRAAPSASFQVLPQRPVAGRWFTTVLTVSNSGGAAIPALTATATASAGGALATLVGGPTPAPPVALAAGGTASFTWTWSANGGGPVAFSATASGVDACGFSPAAPASATTFVTSLDASFSITPRFAAAGSWVQAVLTVTVTGAAGVNGITPALAFNSGATTYTVVAGPVPPGPVSLGAGGIQTFVWTLSVNGASGARLTASATGTDAGTGFTVVGAGSQTGQVRSVLFYGPTWDASMAAAPGIDATLWSESTWSAATTGDFAQFDAIVFGENPWGNPTLWATAAATKAVWSAAVTGNIMVYCGDPFLHAQPLVSQTALLYAADDPSPGPGLAAALGGYYDSSSGTVDFLGVFGQFVASAGGCPISGHVVSTHPALAPITDAMLSYSCGTHGAFDAWPLEFVPFALMRDGSKQAYTAPDGSIGTVHMLRRDAWANPPSVRKTASPATQVASGSPVTFRLAWTNWYAATRSNFIVMDSLPANSRYAAPTQSFWAQSDSLGTPSLTAAEWATSAAGPWNAGEPADGTAGPLVMRWTVNRVAPGRSGFVTFAVRPTGAAAVAGLSNRATLESAGSTPGTAISNTVYLTVLPPVALRKTALVSAGTCPGGQITYTLSWSCLTTATAYALTLTDTLPAGVLLAAGGATFWAGSDALGFPALSASAWAPTLAGPWTAGLPPAGAAYPTVLRWVVERVAPGRTGYIRYGVSISTTATGGMVLANSFGATILGDPDPIYSAAVTSTVSTGTSLAAAAAGATGANSAATFTVTVTITNTGTTGMLTLSATAFDYPAVGMTAARVTGPVPAGPVALAAGAAQTFVWTWRGWGSGPLAFTLSAAGTDACGNVVRAGATRVVTISPLAVAVSSSVSAGTGMLFPVVVTVTNYGPSLVNGVTATVYVSTGPANVVVVSGPSPAGPVSLGAGGGSQSFTWTFSATAGCGLSVFTGTATGTDAGTLAFVGARALASTSTYSGIGGEPANNTPGGGLLLTATTFIQSNGPHQACAADMADWFRIPMVAGGRYAFTTAGVGSSGDNYGELYSDIGGTILVLSDDDAGGNVQFSMTYTAVATQTYYLKVRPYTPSSIWAGSLYYRSIPPALSARLSVSPAAPVVGQLVSITLSVTNAGGLATGVMPSIAVTQGSGSLNGPGGPWPAGPLSMSYGALQTFTWTFTVTGGGTLGWTATAAGADAVWGGSVQAAGSATVFAASFTAGIALSPPSPTIGNWITVTVSATNWGADPVTGTVPALAIAPGASLVSYVSGPVPAGPLTMAAGGTTVFTWTWSVSGGGAIAFTTTVAGIDSGTALPVSARATASIAVAGAMTLGWTPAGLWHAIADGAAPGARPFTSVDPTTWWYGQDGLGNYDTGSANSGRLTSTTVFCPTGSVLEFWSWEQTENFATWDFRDVIVSANGGASWATIFHSSGPENAWRRVQVPLGSSAGNTIQLGFHFDTIDGGANNFLGWFVDDPRIYRPLRTNLALSATVVSTGQPFRAYLTVFNDGMNTVTGTTGSLWIASGGIATAASGGPNPAMPQSIVAGGSLTFTFTLTGLAAGSPVFTATATATDLTTAQPYVSDPAGGQGLLVQSRAALAAALAVPAGPLCVGAPMLVTLTVTNTGQATANGVTPSLPIGFGTGAATWSAGPTPTAPVTLGAGTSVTFTWTFTASSSGSVSFSSTVSGSDGNDGAAVTMPAVSAPVTLDAVTSMAASVACPAVLSAGQSFTVSLTVTAAGGAAVSALSATLTVPSGAAMVTGGPTPAGLSSLASGTATVFTWTLSATGTGPVAFSATVYATGCAGTGLAVAASATSLVQAPAALAAALSLPAGPVCPTTPWLVVLTVTNTGGATANAVTPATPVVTGSGAASASGPTPASANLTGGTAATFTWTFTGTLSGTVTLTASASGTDANSGSGVAITGLVAGPLMIAPPPAVAVTLTHAPATPVPGGPVTWKWIVRNASSATLTSVELVDTLPAGFTFASESSLPALGHAVAGAVHTWSGPVSLAPGMTATIWLDATAGCVAGTVTTTGYARGGSLCGVAANAPVPDAFTLAAPGALVGASSGPAVVSVGQAFGLVLTVTNTGGADVTGTAPAAAAGPGAGLVTGPGSGAPAGPLTLAAGAAQSFAWSATATGPGSVTFTLSANGLACAGASAVTGAATRAVTIQTAATLIGALSVDPATVTTGGIFAVRLTVTNTGQATANSVTPSLPIGFGTGAATWSAGPTPNTPVTLLGGTAITFTYTFTASSSGSVSFSSTASGLDANAGWPVTTGPVMSPPVTINSPPALTGWLSLSRTTASSGQSVQVTLTVSNSGTTAAPAVSAALWKSGGAGGIALAGPTPAVTGLLAGGATVTYSWTLTAGAAGAVALSATATSSYPATSPVATGAMLVQTPAALAAAVTTNAVSLCVGQSFQVRITITNTGQATATGVDFYFPVLTGTGSASTALPPWPLPPVTLGSGQSRTFTYTFTGSAAGTVSFSTTADGVDANTMGPIFTVASGTPPVTLGSPGSLEVDVQAPSTVSTGQWITVLVTATLTGGSGVSGLTPALSFPAGLATLITGPSPASANIASPGNGVAFTYTLSVSGAGSIGYSVTVSGVTCGNPAAPLKVGGGTTTAVYRAVLAAASALSATTVIPGQTRTVTLTVTNTANTPGAAALTVTPALALSGAPAQVVAGPVPATASIAAGAAQTFAWTVSAGGAGTIVLTPSAAGSDQHGGWAVSAAAPARSMASYVPGFVVIDSFTLAPGPNIRFTDTVTATLVFRNPGQSPVQVTLGPGAIIETGPGLLGPASGITPAGPYTLPAGATLSVTWYHQPAGSCGFTGLSVTLTATESDFGAVVPQASALTAALGVAGVPAVLTGSAQPPKVKIRGTTTVMVTVTDACGVPVPGAAVALGMIAGLPGGTITPATGVTDAAGRVAGTLVAGPQPGAYRTRADAGSAPSVTILVEATAPDTPEAFLSQNFFNPGRGERLKIRVMVPAAMPVSVRVYNLAGEPIRKIAEGETAPGLTVFEWDGRNQNGENAANGVFFVQTIAGGTRDTRRVIVLRR